MSNTFPKTVINGNTFFTHHITITELPPFNFNDPATHGNIPFHAPEDPYSNPMGVIIAFHVLFTNTDISTYFSDYTYNYRYRNSLYVSNHNKMYYRLNMKLYHNINQDFIDYLGQVSGIITLLFMPESYVHYLSSEHANRIGMVIKLQQRIMPDKPIQSAPLSAYSYVYVLAVMSICFGYPRRITSNSVEYAVPVLSHLLLLSSNNRSVIDDMLASHAFTLEFNLPVEFGVLDYARGPVLYGIRDYYNIHLGSGTQTSFMNVPYTPIRIV